MKAVRLKTTYPEKLLSMHLFITIQYIQDYDLFKTDVGTYNDECVVGSLNRYLIESQSIKCNFC